MTESAYNTMVKNAQTRLCGPFARTLYRIRDISSLLSVGCPSIQIHLPFRLLAVENIGQHVERFG